MSIRPEYFQLLDHIGCAVALRDLAETPDEPNVIGMRHDIDHDLDLALEMGWHEHQRGLRATYYLLHTAQYWNDPAFAAKCQQLVAYGHEIGLHVNALTEWWRGDVVDPEQSVERALEQLRSSGVEVTSVSAHGDPACYEHGFIGYWMWAELRGDDPARDQAGMSAEGVRVDDPAWQVPYPGGHRLQRSDGAVYALWQASMARHGLSFDAAHLAVDRYWSDSGGTWQRTGDPIDHDLAAGRHQILVHPWWWRGKPKIVFVMGCARSGSKWLANFVEQATSAQGVHEWTLNHVRDGKAFPCEQRTTNDLRTLIDDLPETRRRIRAGLDAHKLAGRDTIECNVYLETFLKEFRVIAPETLVVHLHREPLEVVRSILQRGWYETPGDHRHRDDGTVEWRRADQIERACRYVRSVNERLIAIDAPRLSFEEMTRDRSVLERWLAPLGIVVHPRLADGLFEQRVNVSTDWTVPRIEDWPAIERDRALALLHGVRVALGYADGGDGGANGKSRTGRWKQARFGRRVLPPRRGQAPRGHRVDVTQRQGKLALCIASEAADAHVMLTDTGWHKAGPGVLPVKDASSYQISVTVDASTTASGRLFVIGYDAEGASCHRAAVLTLRPSDRELTCSFRPGVDWRSFAVAVHLGGNAAGATMTIAGWELWCQKLRRGYTAEEHISAITSDSAGG